MKLLHSFNKPTIKPVPIPVGTGIKPKIDLKTLQPKLRQVKEPVLDWVGRCD